MLRWERARAGDGRLALVVGEPGLGKSRLLEEFHARLGETPHTWVEWRASQLLQNTPLHPVAEWGQQRFGDADSPSGQRLADLEGALRQVKVDANEAVPLIAPLLGIPLPPGCEPSLAPEELRRRQLAAIVGWIMAGARSQPVVLAFEDLQWADPTSIEVLLALSKRSAQTPLFLVATARPEFCPPWGMRPHHDVVSLAPLDRAEVLRMIGELAARHALSKDVAHGVSERAGGVPLFVEEVTRLLLERGEQGRAQAIPLTLQQSLSARLDRLGEAREIAQIGAVLGRDFSYALLSAAGGVADAALQSALDRLAAADILFVEGVAPHSTYRFKHALIQDAAYESLLKSSRQALHRRAAELLCNEPERAAAEPEIVARHFTQAGLDKLAIEWWGKAGDQALRRSAFQEAIAHLGKAIEMADKADSTAVTTLDQRLKLQTDYGHAVMWSKGFAARETRAAFGSANLPTAGSANADERTKVYVAGFLRALVGGNVRAAREMAQRFLRQAEEEQEPPAIALGRRQLGMACLFCGELAEAKRQLEFALATAVHPEHARDLAQYAVEARASASGYLAIANWHLGDIDRARMLMRQAIALAEESGHTPTIVNARWEEATLEVYRNDAVAALPAAEAAASLGRQHGIAYYASGGDVLAKWADGLLRQSPVAVAALQTALTSYIEGGNKIGAPCFHGLLAELAFAARDAHRALALIDKGLANARETAEHIADSYLYRLRGDILLEGHPTDPAPAEQAFQTAISVAKEQGARSYALLASLPLARLYLTTDRPIEAHAVLALALEGFSPTPEMPEIAEAQALMERLA